MGVFEIADRESVLGFLKFAIEVPIRCIRNSIIMLIMKKRGTYGFQGHLLQISGDNFETLHKNPRCNKILKTSAN